MHMKLKNMLLTGRVWWPAIGVAAGSLLAISCGSTKAANSQMAFPPAMVSVIEVKPEDVAIFAEYSAQTFARDMVEVRGRVDGYIEKRLFQVGSDVNAGQVLYTLDLRPYQAEVAKATSQVAHS